MLYYGVGSLVFYLTKYLRYILYSFLLLIITLFLLFTVHLYDANLGLLTFLSLRVGCAETFLVNFLRNVAHFLTYVCFLFIIIPHISYIISAFWRKRNNSRSRPWLLSFSFCHWNLNSIAAHNFLTTPYIRLILSVY